MTSKAEKRADAMRRLLTHARERLGLQLGFHLWDGSTVPADLAPDALAIRLADENLAAALIRHPGLETLANLWVAKRIDIVGGTMFDLVKQRPTVKTRAFRKSLDKGLALKTTLAFLTLPRGGPWPLEAQPKERPSDGSAAENKENIAYHYDVSNAFYALFLDKEMVYTCGYARDWDNDLDRMQADKLEMICRKLRLKPGDRLLDIGSGWGALVCHAALHHGVIAHGVTLSEEQVAYATEKVRRLGLEDRVTIELRDYTTVEGPYDKISSIGMQEHIGLDNHDTYYRTVKRVLAPGGIFLNHAITRPAKRKRFRKKNKEFALLTRYIFPGGELDHIGDTLMRLEQNGFEIHDVEAWREHYQRTCRHWHNRLLANYESAVAEVGEPKTRLWLAYLGACSIAFERNTVGVFQTVATKKQRGASGLPPTREDLYRPSGEEGRDTTPADTTSSTSPSPSS